MHTYINIYFIYIDVFCVVMYISRRQQFFRFPAFFSGNTFEGTHKCVYTRAHARTHAYMQTRTHVTITSQHPPLYSNQGWKYHQTGPDPRTCVEIYPGRTLETVNRESSFPSSSYASGPRGPPWTEPRTRERKREEKRGWK